MDKNKLKELYLNTSKHSNYQILPNCLRPYFKSDELIVNSRFEEERLKFLLKHIDFEGKQVMDIGGNTGYFSFELIENGAERVIYVEGNREHAEFVQYAAGELNQPIEVYNEYLDLEKENSIPFDCDITLLFNVVHHLGDDFGAEHLSIEQAKKQMVNFINYFSSRTKILVLQMGFCWKGDRTKLLFENGTKREMIDFIREAISDQWTMQVIGIAEVNSSVTSYRLLNEENVERNDTIGEFRNRPIFVLNRNY